MLLIVFRLSLMAKDNFIGYFMAILNSLLKHGFTKKKRLSETRQIILKFKAILFKMYVTIHFASSNNDGTFL